MKKYLLILFTLACFVINNEIIQAQTRVECPKCNGSKKEIKRCGSCHNGAVLCGSCSGSKVVRVKCHGCSEGYTSKTIQKTCNNCNGRKSFSENRPIICTACKGRKQVPTTTRGGNVAYVNCQRCRGTGQLDNFVNVACRPCGGRGVSGTETIREKHSCNNGYVTSNCISCRGVGSKMCHKCNGYANIQSDCNRCEGRGIIYVSY